MANLLRRSVLAKLATLPIVAAGTTTLAGTVARAADECPHLVPPQDWPQIEFYRAANAELLASRAPVDVVFMGDSITQGWPDKRPDFFTTGRICRGIGGQTTPQMVLRMMSDVLPLRPKIVHIMGGTNDIAGNTGPITLSETIANLEAMALIAKGVGITVIIGSVPPAANFPWRPGLETAQAIAAMNDQIRQLAIRHGVIFADYTPVLANGLGGMRDGLAYDGVHPDVTGYVMMESALAPILRVTVTAR
jgi:lysophospholipase L1-like esterase